MVIVANSPSGGAGTGNIVMRAPNINGPKAGLPAFVKKTRFMNDRLIDALIPFAAD